MKEIQSANEIIKDLKSENSQLHAKVQSAENESISLREQNINLKKALEAASSSQTVCTVPPTPVLPSLSRTDDIPVHRQAVSVNPINPSEPTLIIGDSHARGIASELNSIASVNYCTGVVYGGRRIEHFDLSTTRRYNKVILMAGSNNISTGDSFGNIHKKLTTAIQNINNLNPGCSVFLHEIYPRCDLQCNEEIRALNSRLRHTCKEMGVHFIKCPRLGYSDFTKGGLHLNNLGKSKICKSISRQLNSSSLNGPFLQSFSPP